MREKAISRQQPEITSNINHSTIYWKAHMTNEDMAKFGDTGMDIMAINSLGAWTKGAQAIAVEVVDYSKKSAESTAAAWQKLMGAKSLEKAIEVQTEYLKSSYEDFIVQASKLGELYVDLAKETYKPFDALLSKAP
jgi:hypothetical protein